MRSLRFRALLVFVSAFVFSGCGVDLSGKNTESQQDEGYWFCKLAFSYDHPTRIEDFLADSEWGLGRLRDVMTQDCLSSFTAKMEACSAAIKRDEFRCLHESQVNAPADQDGVWFCQLDYSYNDGFATRGERIVGDTASSRSTAIGNVFDDCASTRQDKRDGCSEAILDGALVCGVR